jgi:hypothetical protein
MTTSKKQSRQAGKDLRDPKTPKKDRGPIASALAQSKHKPKKRKWPMGSKSNVQTYTQRAIHSHDTNAKLDAKRERSTSQPFFLSNMTSSRAVEKRFGLWPNF